MHASPELVISHLLNNDHFARPQGERVVCSCGHRGNYGHHIGRVLTAQLGLTLGDTDSAREAISAVSATLGLLGGPDRAATNAQTGLDRYVEPEVDLLDFDVHFSSTGGSGVRRVRAHDVEAAKAMVPGAHEAIWRMS